MELEEVIEAYFDCRRNKRNTQNQLRFEINYEQECIRLWDDLETRNYRPGRSIAFVVDRPVKREIFAADFRDRVVHHIIARRIYPLLEKQFHKDSYSTQKGKGTLYGQERIAMHMKDCSENYTKDCYVMKLDIQGFFMSIDKQRLFERTMLFLSRFVPKESQWYQELHFMISQTIFNRPEVNCIRKMPRSRWKDLPPNKSLFNTDGTHGLPIGNFTSQLLALLYLDPLDHQMTGNWEIVHYGRYVDDMVMIHPDENVLLDVKDKVNQWLCGQNLTLHPRKFYLQHYRKGVAFIGGVIKPGRRYLSHRTVARIYSRVHHFSAVLSDFESISEKDLASIRATLNSYLGMLNHYMSVRLFHRVMQLMGEEWYFYFYIQRCGKRSKLVLRRTSRNKNLTKCQTLCEEEQRRFFLCTL